MRCRRLERVEQEDEKQHLLLSYCTGPWAEKARRRFSLLYCFCYDRHCHFYLDMSYIYPRRQIPFLYLLCFKR
jgi:hypothetical protein